jgi:putative ABC transport system ATP-binding protein
MALILLSNVHHRFGDGPTQVRALRGIDLTVAAGEFVALMGPSGSGKSTLLSVLGAMMPPSDGRVVVDEIDVYSLHVERLADFRRQYLGFVFQHLYLVPYLSAIENVMLPLAAASIDNAEQRARAASALLRVGLADKTTRLPAELSGGEQQRVAIARAIVNAPPLLLADEPTGCLDSATGKEIVKLLLELRADGLTVFMVTHDAAVASAADRIVRLRDGSIDACAA